MLAGFFCFFFWYCVDFSTSAPGYTLRGADDKMRGFEDYQPHTS